MGYQTDFWGGLQCDPPLNGDQVQYLQAFNGTRRMRRDETIVATFPDPLREAVGLPVGFEGGFYVGADRSDFGQTKDESVTASNDPPGGKTYGFVKDENGKDIWTTDLVVDPRGQPGLWCQWTTEDGTSIVWDEGEKFYNYVEWLTYIIENFLDPWGVKLVDGEIHWDGEESDDYGKIVAEDGLTTVQHGTMGYGDPQPIFAPPISPEVVVVKSITTPTIGISDGTN